MKAVVITSYGGVEGIGIEAVDTPPAPTADRVRVRVHAAGLNRADILQRRGHYPPPPGYRQIFRVWSSQAKWNQSARRFAPGRSAIAFLGLPPAARRRSLSSCRRVISLVFRQSSIGCKRVRCRKFLSPRTMRSLPGQAFTRASAFSFTRPRPELAPPQSKWPTPRARRFMARRAQRISWNGFIN